jgi:hypothetical protein
MLPAALGDKTKSCKSVMKKSELADAFELKVYNINDLRWSNDLETVWRIGSQIPLLI